MNIIETILPGNFSDAEKYGMKLREKLKYLFSSPEFQNKVKTLRDQFNLPAHGIKSFRKDSSIPESSKIFEKKLFNYWALIRSNSGLKRWDIKSQKKKFDRKIAELRKEYKLPMRFQFLLVDFVIFNKILKFGEHTAKCSVTIFKDGNEKRLFIEIYGDTKKQDLIKAWPEISSAIQDHQLSGEHLFRYKNFYPGLMKLKNLRPVDSLGNAVEDEKFQCYIKNNIDKSRYKKHLEENYSK